MIDLVKKFFDKSATAGGPQRDKEESYDIRIATCALFLEMANIDGEFSEDEQQNINVR